MLARVLLLSTGVLVLAMEPTGLVESPAAVGFDAVTTQQVVEATLAQGSAHISIDQHASAAEPPEDHGLSGFREIDQHFELDIDFESRDAIMQFQLEGLVASPTNVEIRVVDGTQYVRDGSWLCPFCGFEPSDPAALPADMWIELRPCAAAPMRELGMNNGLGGSLTSWLAVFDLPIEAANTDIVDDVMVGVYTASVSRAVAEEALQAIDPDHPLSTDLQGDVVHITLLIDRLHVLRQVTTEYRADDRNRRDTWRLNRFHEPVEVSEPHPAEIYRGWPAECGQI